MYSSTVREYVALQKFKDSLGYRGTHHSIITHVFFINWVYQQLIDSADKADLIHNKPSHLVLLAHLICED